MQFISDYSGFSEFLPEKACNARKNNKPDNFFQTAAAFFRSTTASRRTGILTHKICPYLYLICSGAETASDQTRYLLIHEMDVKTSKRA